MNPQFEKHKFSVVYGSDKYNENFNQAFGRNYFLDFIEEYWPGQKVKYMGRVGVTDERKQRAYAEEEIRFAFNNTEKYYSIREKWDWKRVNKEELEEVRKILKEEMDNTLKEIE